MGGPAQWAVLRRKCGRMTCEASLRVGLGHAAADQEIDDSALACASAANDRNMKGAGRLFLKVGADAIAHERTGKQQPASLCCSDGLVATIGLKPAQIFSKLPGQVDLDCIHHPLDLSCVEGRRA